mgnify:CR=1 FL=1
MSDNLPPPPPPPPGFEFQPPSIPPDDDEKIENIKQSGDSFEDISSSIDDLLSQKVTPVSISPPPLPPGLDLPSPPPLPPGLVLPSSPPLPITYDSKTQPEIEYESSNRPDSLDSPKQLSEI